MKESKFLVYLGIVISIIALIGNKVPTVWLFVIALLSFVACIIISRIEYNLSNSHLKWIDCLYYIFSKRNSQVKIHNRIIYYKINTREEAELSVESAIEYLKPVTDYFSIGKYHWEQDERVEISIVNCDNYMSKREIECNWVDVLIKNKMPTKRKQLANVGFKLTKLKINNLARESFISYNITDKVKNLEFVANVSKELAPLEEAELIVKNIYGITIKVEKVKYDDVSHSFKKTVHYPRKGRTYILKWAEKEEIIDC